MAKKERGEATFGSPARAAARVASCSLARRLALMVATPAYSEPRSPSRVVPCPVLLPNRNIAVFACTHHRLHACMLQNALGSKLWQTSLKCLTCMYLAKFRDVLIARDSILSRFGSLSTNNFMHLKFYFLIPVCFCTGILSTHNNFPVVQKNMDKARLLLARGVSKCLGSFLIHT